VLNQAYDNQGDNAELGIEEAHVRDRVFDAKPEPRSISFSSVEYLRIFGGGVAEQNFWDLKVKTISLPANCKCEVVQARGLKIESG
jgi:hypothetical protein